MSMLESRTSSRLWRAVSVVLGCFSALCFAGLVHADAGQTDAFQVGTSELAEGRYQAAIDHFEAHADRQPAHPDASFNRGLAYLQRVRKDAERPGDLGQAAAGFEETLSMRPDDVEAERALHLIRGEVARRLSRSGRDVVIARPSLDRVVVQLASEWSWALASVSLSLLLALGLLLRRRPRGAVHLTGVMLAPAALCGLLATLPLYWAARQISRDERPAVLVVREAHMTDEYGVTLGAAPIPEAALLAIREQRAALVFVRYGAREGWLPQATVRALTAR